MRNSFRLPLTAALLLAGSPQALAAASILIWPIDPVIEDQQQATALWLENRDSKPVYMQIRVLGWQQTAGKDDYRNQSEVIASPPVASIAPGKRQLIRLIKQSAPAAGQERAYRVLIDEVPIKDQSSGATPDGAQMGLKFQMRYSVPLFVSGKGIWTKQDSEKPRDYASASQPQLSYRLLQQSSQRWLEVRNQGAVHARISKVTLQGKTLNPGLMGYVLPGSQMRFALPPAGNFSGGALQATVNDNKQPVTLSSH
ncbi:fimbrial biogenesis chaperone [Serratia entomophila]|uniref:fimbrial biogenesis chaperone n=1 Tax=Serratia entomophila TaxID=42906 RepID=UPI00217963C8|nr:molecular chaperone [Serratia entomophila]CAI1666363.1 putative fimbrial chaperone protein [Serratia entomophila]